MSHTRARRFLLMGVSLVLVFILTAFTTGSTAQQDWDFSTIVLELDDLPAGFAPLTGADLDRMESVISGIGETISGASEASLQNFTGFRTSDLSNPQIVISGIIAPLSSLEQLAIDQQLANSDTVMEQLGQGLGGDGAALLSGAQDIGQNQLAFSVSTDIGSMRLDYVVARRGPVLIEVAYWYQGNQTPPTSAIELARLLDQRAIDVVGAETSFRTAGPLVPDLTTYIPTPLDVSTRPGVIGANLFLAALLMLPFAVAAEIFTRVLLEHEEDLRHRVRLVDWVAQLQMKLEAVTGSSLRRGGLEDALKVLGVIFFYGLVFSLLDRTWNPFSAKGLVLFISMMIAYGIVGIADDLFQWRAIRRWGLQADLTVRPTNFLLAAFSTTASRLFTLVPGMMFGTPEALTTDEDQFDEPKRIRLLRISAWTLSGVVLIVWLPTALTAILQMLDLAEATKNLIGCVEAFLLVVFAVALENLFIQLVGMPGTLGQALKQRSRWGWLVAFGAVTFLFYHTLINPRGELAQAVKQGNVVVFFSIAVAFMLIAFGLQFYLGRRERVLQTSSVRVEAQAPSESRHRERKSAAPRMAAVQKTAREASAPVKQVILPDAEKTLAVIPYDDCKRCPICGEMIKAEARLCRFCRATFTVSVKGYCLRCHDVVEISGERKCMLCGSEPKDIHVESRLLKAPTVIPPRLNTEMLPKQEASATNEDGNVKQCPVCGQTLKAEALMCRFCRARFDVRERGYCLRDHAVVDVKEGNCIQCGESVQDIHFESTLIGDGAAVTPVIIAPTPQKQTAVPFQPKQVASHIGQIATVDQQTQHMSLILNWCERNKDRTIHVEVVTRLGERETVVNAAHGKIREIEEHPEKKGIFRIEFDSKLKVSSEFDVIMLGYEISGVTEHDRQLIIQKGPDQRIELAVEMEAPKNEKVVDISGLVAEALAIIDASAIQIVPGGYIKFSGEGSGAMCAAEKLGEAHGLNPDDPWLHFGYASALQLAGQYKTGRDEMEKLAQSHPDFLPACFALKGWEKWDGLFTLPPWSPKIQSVHPAISGALKGGYVMGTRDGLHPRATLFLRDAGGDFVNSSVLQSARIDITTVVSDTNLPLAIVYARIWDNPQSPFRIEALGAPLYPRGHVQRCKYEYLCLQEDIDFAVIDRRNNILLNKRLPMPARMQESHAKLLRLLQDDAGHEISDAELIGAVRLFQSHFSLNDVRY